MFNIIDFLSLPKKSTHFNIIFLCELMLFNLLFHLGIGKSQQARVNKEVKYLNEAEIVATVL